MTLGESATWNLVVELAWVGLPPLVAAAVTMLAARRLNLQPRAAWAASVGVGYVVGQLGLVGRAGFVAALAALVSPHEARDWLPWAVLLAAGATIWVAHAGDSSRWIGHVLAVVIALAAPARLLGGSVWVVTRWAAGAKIVYLALLAAAMGLVWWLLEAADDDDQPLVRSMLLIYVAVGMAVTLTLSGSFAYGELAGAAGAAVTGALLAGVLKQTSPDNSPPTAFPDGVGGAAGVVTFSLGSLILLGYFYTEVTAVNAALLAVALVVAAGRLPTLGLTSSGWRAVVRATFCIVPMALAVAGAYAATQSQPVSPY